MIHFLPMAYRPTAQTEERKARTRERIIEAARDLIAAGGYREAQVASVAARAGLATGSVYRHFPSKADLFAEVFRHASQREVDVVAAAARADGRPAVERIAAAVEAFARRALRARRLAFALVAEPVDPAIEAERLTFRHAYRDVFLEVIEDGIASGELPPQDPEVSAAAIVGGLAEALVGPLSPTGEARDPDALVNAIVAFCTRSVTAKEPAHVHA